MNQQRKVTWHQQSEDDNSISITPIGETAGGAPARYWLEFGELNCMIPFQDGPVPDVGVNGVTIEALLAVCLDRLSAFQNGKFPCSENAVAIDHLAAAMNALHMRTTRRVDGGIEGKLVEENPEVEQALEEALKEAAR